MVKNRGAHKYDRNLDRIFQALSDTTRRQILGRLASGPVAASELARPTGLALPTVMRHLSVLEAADLIVTVKTGRRRLCQANGEALGATIDWMIKPRVLWEHRTDRLEAAVATLISKDAQ